jgi:hypothetical protein
VVSGFFVAGVIINQDKSANDTKADFLIASHINTKFIGQGLKNPTNKIGVTVDRQRVLLTGIVSDANVGQKANEIAWEVDGVKEVIDEIQVNDSKTIFGNLIHYFADVSTTSRIVYKALINKNIHSINFEVVTINKVVYLIGTSRSASEIKEISELASKTTGVSKVINHIILLND